MGVGVFITEPRLHSYTDGRKSTMTSTSLTGIGLARAGFARRVTIDVIDYVLSIYRTSL